MYYKLFLQKKQYLGERRWCRGALNHADTIIYSEWRNL
nr:MAG TPA: hypothetical protein [Caudoviricetes sp.]